MLVRVAVKAAELVIGDAAAAEILDQSMAGCDKALLILPNSEARLDMDKQFTDRARAAGAKHVVKLSSMEAMANSRSPIRQDHCASEEHLRASCLTWTMIKPNFFMQNLLPMR